MSERVSDRMTKTLRFAIIFYTTFFVAFLLFWFGQKEQQQGQPAHQVRGGKQQQDNSKLIIHLRIVPQGLSI